MEYKGTQWGRQMWGLDNDEKSYENLSIQNNKKLNK